MKKIVFILIGILTTLDLFSQNFSKIIDDWDNIFYNRISVVSDSLDNTLVANNNGDAVALVKYNSLGTLIWSKSIDIGSQVGSYYLLSANTLLVHKLQPFLSQNHESYLIQFDSNGIVTNSKVTNDQITSPLALSSGKYFFNGRFLDENLDTLWTRGYSYEYCGNKFNFENNVSSAQHECNNGDIILLVDHSSSVSLIARINSIGEVIWSGMKAIGYNGSIIELKDGSFLIAHDANGEHYTDLTKIDSLGNTLWTMETENFVKVLKSDDGGFYLLGSINNAVQYCSPFLPSQTESDITVSKYNSAGSNEWSKQFDLGHREWKCDADIDSKGKIIIAGLSDDINIANYYKSFLVKTSPDTSLKCGSTNCHDFSAFYSFSPQTSIDSLSMKTECSYPEFNPSKSLVISGSFPVQFSATNNISTIDNVITDSTLCSSSSTVHVQSTEITEALSVYPNPSSGIYNISAKTNWKLFDYQGQFLKSELSNKVDLQNHASGIYFLNINRVFTKIIKK